MNLEANASRGYAMAALLVAMAVMAVLMTVALPTWKQAAQREKEEELIFRGTQYARAIGAYQRKYANASPATIDVLIEQHFLRKKYKDPLAVTDDGEFAMLYVANQAPGSQGTGSQGAQSRGAGSGVGSAPASGAGMLASTTPSGNIIGVASKNPGQSLRTYNDHDHYNEWQFMALQLSTTAGGGAGGQGGGASGQGGGPAGREVAIPRAPARGAGRCGPGGPGGPGAEVALRQRQGTGNRASPEGRGQRGGAGGSGVQGTPQQGGGRGRKSVRLKVGATEVAPYGRPTDAWRSSRRRAGPDESAGWRCSRVSGARDWSAAPHRRPLADLSTTTSP